MDRLARLEAVEAIRNLKARYFRCMDCKDWDELPGLFTRGMKVITPEGAVYTGSGAAYAAALRGSLEAAVSCHQGLTAEIEVLDEANARGVWAMQDVLEWPDRHPRTGWKSLVGRG
ncbi:MAG: nuclear transport factor 2 family protein, partial [Sphingomonadales bacterium]|nr:nuclear transport factor 2 family protein [Sphingomonadales bacterium]